VVKSQSSRASSEDKKFKKVKGLTTKVSISEFDEFVGKAIAALATEKDQWVSEQKAAQYLIDFNDKGFWQTFKQKQALALISWRIAEFLSVERRNIHSHH
jgi:hypothetical protein